MRRVWWCGPLIWETWSCFTVGYWQTRGVCVRVSCGALPLSHLRLLTCICVGVHVRVGVGIGVGVGVGVGVHVASSVQRCTFLSLSLFQYMCMCVCGWLGGLLWVCVCLDTYGVLDAHMVSCIHRSSVTHTYGI